MRNIREIDHVVLRVRDIDAMTCLIELECADGITKKLLEGSPARWYFVSISEQQ